MKKEIVEPKINYMCIYSANKSFSMLKKRSWKQILLHIGPY